MLQWFFVLLLFIGVLAVRFGGSIIYTDVPLLRRLSFNVSFVRCLGVLLLFALLFCDSIFPA